MTSANDINIEVVELNPKYQLVCDATLEGKGRREAGLLAGYPDSPSIKQVVCKVLALPECKQYIKDMQEETARVNIKTGTMVLNRLAEFASADIIDIIDEDSNTLKPVHQWTPSMRKMVKGVTIREIFEGYGKEREVIGQTVDVKMVDPLKVLELIGQHIDVGAYRKQVEHTHTHYAGLEDKLRAGRRRAFDSKSSSTVIEDRPSGGKDFDTGEVIKTVSVSGSTPESLALESGISDSDIKK